MNFPFDTTVPPPIYHYLEFRAEQEGLAFGLKFEYLWRQLILGHNNFWGVLTNSLGKVLTDTQYPELVSQFSKHKK
jgi:hypothetical protein